MKHEVMAVSVLVLVLLSVEGIAAEASDYAGQEVRQIKALSDSDVADLLSGKGMGYAKAAELNGYPGPAHVLELADELKLSVEQRAKTQAVFDRMEDSAKKLGADLVAAEQALDQMFRTRAIDESSLSELSTKIGRIESELRVVHLDAHLEQSQLLTRRQIDKYMMLRGYGGPEHENHHHHHDR